MQLGNEILDQSPAFDASDSGATPNDENGR
jgi:hypothetical protein